MGVGYGIGLFVDVVDVEYYQFVFGDVVGYVDFFYVLVDQEQCVVDDGVGQCDFQYDQGSGSFVLVQCVEDGVDVYGSFCLVVYCDLSWMVGVICMVCQVGRKLVVRLVNRVRFSVSSSMLLFRWVSFVYFIGCWCIVNRLSRVRLMFSMFLIMLIVLVFIRYCRKIWLWLVLSVWCMLIFLLWCRNLVSSRFIVLIRQIFRKFSVSYSCRCMLLGIVLLKFSYFIMVCRCMFGGCLKWLVWCCWFEQFFRQWWQLVVLVGFIFIQYCSYVQGVLSEQLLLLGFLLKQFMLLLLFSFRLNEVEIGSSRFLFLLQLLVVRLQKCGFGFYFFIMLMM